MDIDEIIKALDDRQDHGPNDLHKLVYNLALEVRRMMPDRCGRCGNAGASMSACPFGSEINGNEEPCKCCGNCRHECAMDI